jgi:uncharacterized protein (TIGR03437 family)
MSSSHRYFYLFVVLFLSAQTIHAQQTAIIPITETTNSNGAFVRGASNDGKRIVFESSNDFTGENKDGNNEIFVYDADLRQIIQITRTGSQAGTGGGSGGAVLQASNCPGGCEPASFTPTNAVPAISGDGTRIVFASSSGLLTDIPNPDGNVELYLATLPRGATVATMLRLTETDGLKDSFDNNTPAINYDGSVITFVSTRRFFRSRGVQIFSAQNDDNIAQVFVYEVNTKKFTQVTHKRVDEGIDGFEVKGFIANPFISGDGKTVAFLSGFNFGGTVNNADLNGEIFLYKVGDAINQVTQVTNTTELAEVPEDGAVNVLSRFSKHLSDDGSLLVFESTGGTAPVKTGEKIRDVFLYNATTKTFTQITTQDVGKKDLSDFNYFPSLNGAGTFITFSSKLNLPVINDTAGNFNNSREVYRYDIAASTPANPRYSLVTQTELSDVEGDQRLILLAPFVSDDGAIVSFSNNGNLLAPNFNSTPEVFQAVLRSAVRATNQTVAAVNAASLDTTGVARGSVVAALGSQLANNNAESSEVDNYPFELNGVSITVGDSTSGIAARLISVSPTQINFIFPTGIAADRENSDGDDAEFTINNNGVISKGKIHVRDASPGLYTVNSNGRGIARAQCSQASDDGSETLYTALPCPIGYENTTHSIVLYGTGWRNGADIKVRFRFQLENGEEDEIEVTPSYAGAYVDDNNVTHLGLDQIVVALDADLANRINVDTKVVLISNSEALTSQDEVVTSFSTFDEDLSVINAASQESGPLARGSIALALIQNDDEEEDVFTEQTLTASVFNPPFELGGIRIKVAGADARILSISPETVKFILPVNIEPNTNVLVRLTNGQKTFYTRTQVQDAAPGLFTVTDDGDGKVSAQCGLYLANGTVEVTAPPCAISAENERRVVVLQGTGWRYASGVKVTFNSIELTPTYAGAEPGIPGVDRIEITLPLSLAEDIGGLEKDIIVTASVNGTTTASQSGATLAFQEVVNDEAQARPSERTTTRRNAGSTQRQTGVRKR